MSEHDFDDLVRAWRAHRADPAHSAAYAALAAAFGADLDRPPAEDLESEIVHGFALGAQERLDGLPASPFAGLLEAPPAIVAAHQRHARDIGEHLEGARAALDRLVRELLAGLYPDAAGRTVTLP